jgi:ubiquinone/menaquinone biosynthesis C-methylase UbiE
MSTDTIHQVQGSGGWTAILEAFAGFVQAQPGQRVLDVGCGPGALVRLLARRGCQVVGVDTDPAMVSRAEELAAGLPGAEFRQGSVLALPFADGEFDLVTATNVIFLLPEPVAGLAEMARVCRPGGRVAMLNPAARLSQATARAYAAEAGLNERDTFSLTNWGRIAETHPRFTRAELKAMLPAAGLALQAVEAQVGRGLALFARAVKKPA